MTFLERLSKNTKYNSCFTILGLFILCISFFLGCSEDRDKITPSPEDNLPAIKEALKVYHPVEFLSTEFRSAPMLSQKNHPDGWNKSNCIQCHRTPTKLESSVCNNCHGKNGVNSEKDTCSNCHKVQSEFGEPASGSHQSHITKGPKDTNCTKCHPGSPEKSKSHANGRVDITLAKDGKYTPVKDENGIIGTCSSVNCHGDERKWGGDCSSCHYDPPDTGYHKQHITQENISCQSCHLGNQHDSNNSSGEIDLGGITYNKNTGSCTSTCHEKPLSWACSDCHKFPPNTPGHSQKSHIANCDECHSNHTHSYKSATRPLDFSGVKVSFANAGSYKEANKSCSDVSCHESVASERVWGSSCNDCHSSMPNTGTHTLHIQQENIKCQDCHSGAEHDIYNHSKPIELGGTKVKYNYANGNCTTTCHKDQKWGCLNCHAYPPSSGSHPAHNGDCEKCHKDHRHSYKSALAPKDFSDTAVNLAGGGAFNKGSKFCSGTPCHESRTWGESCTTCHANPPKTGSHVLHVQNEKISCQSCHKDSKHKTGSIELGGIQYNANNGDCTSSCHTKRSWGSCTDCHAYPPSTGNHKDHNLGCEQCHANHQHSDKAALSPKDFSGVKVSFASGVTGSFDSNSQGCSNVSCHTDLRTWGENCSACHASPPKTGYHSLHVQTQKLSCQSCHKGNQHDPDVQSGSIELGGIQYNSITGDCTSNCHGKQKWTCIDCHAYPPVTGNHKDHNLACDQCHSNHQHSYKSAMSPKDFSGVKVGFASGVTGSFDSKSQGCSNVSCHTDLRTWGENCSACHGNPPKTGSHAVHIDQAKLNCQNCHKGNQHDLDISSGFIDVSSDVSFDQFGGSCKNSCHAKSVSWNCTACHNYPQKTGEHGLHSSYNCNSCHKDHKHTYKAAISPKDFGNAKVTFTISGTYDKAKKTCNGIGCHGSEQW